MPRSHGVLKTEVWDVGSDFRRLTVPGQWAYVMLLSQPQISNCGVLTYLPDRWIRLADQLTHELLTRALAELRRELFVVVDETWGELLVRTFIKHDRIGRQPNLVTAARREYREIESQLIRDILSHQHPWLADDRAPEAVRAYEDERKSEPLPEALSEPLREALPEPLPESLWKTVLETPSRRGQRARDADDPAPTPAPSPLRDEGLEVNAANAANGLAPAAIADDQHDDRRPFSRTAAEAWIRNVGWMDPHPEHYLIDTYANVPAHDLHDLVALAKTLQDAEQPEPAPS